jgi:nicotinate-nucleotide adenylyltransferase
MGVALMGGTFDPIHIGHLRSAEEIVSLLGLNSIRLVPSNIPPHRSLPGTAATQRLDMIKLAISSNERLEVDDREMRREGRSYSIDTLCDIRFEIGKERPLYFVLGSDAYQLFSEWHRWQEVTRYAHLVVIDRPPIAEGDHRAGLPKELEIWSEPKQCEIEEMQRCPAGGICHIELTQMDVSSTKIRSMLATGMSTRYLLSDSVRRYIDEKELYR